MYAITELPAKLAVLLGTILAADQSSVLSCAMRERPIMGWKGCELSAEMEDAAALARVSRRSTALHTATSEFDSRTRIPRRPRRHLCSQGGTFKRHV